MILLSAASLVSTAIVRREQAKTLAEQRKAEAAYRRERQRAEEAEARFRLARRAVDELIRVSEEELAHRPGMEGLRKRLLASALAYYQRVHRPAAERPGCAGRAARHHAAGRDDPRRPGGAPRRRASSICSSSPRPSTTCGSTKASGRRWPSSPPVPAALDGRLRRPRPPAPPAERVRIGLEQARANEAEVDAILTPSQRVRLRQIALQSEGPAAFREPEVVEALGLTPAQRERIRAIEDEALFGQIREMQSGRPLEDAGKPAMERILAVLTAEQARRWNELAGEPIRGPLSAFPMPFRPRAIRGGRPLTASRRRLAGHRGYHEKSRLDRRATRCPRIASLPDRGVVGSRMAPPPRADGPRSAQRSSPREVTQCVDEPSPWRRP